MLRILAGAVFRSFVIALPHLLEGNGSNGIYQIGQSTDSRRSRYCGQDSQTISTVTNQDGAYAFPPLGPGTWKVTVEMFGFETLTKEVDYSAVKGLVNLQLDLKESRFARRFQPLTKSRGARPAARNPNA